MLSIAPSPSPLSGAGDQSSELAYVEGAINADNGTTGWKFAAARLYAAWGDTLFNAAATPPNAGSQAQRVMASGHSLLFSIKPTSGDGAIPTGLDVTGTWNFIATGGADADLARHVSELQALLTSGTWNPTGATIYLCYHHEIDGDGDAATFIAMWQHVVDYFQAHMSSSARAHLRWVWNPTSFGFTTGGGNRAPTYYPGDAYVDYVAADGYNRMPANNATPTAFAGTYSSFGPDVADAAYDNGQDIFGVVVSWARANTGAVPGPSGLPNTSFGAKPLQIWEWASWPQVLPPADFPGGPTAATDFGTSTLAANLGASATSMTLVSASSGSDYYFPKKGPYAVLVEPGTASEERVIVGAGGTPAVSGNTLLNLSRASGVAHPSGATVVLAEDKGDGTGTGMRARFIHAAGDQLALHWTDVKLISYFDSSRGSTISNQEWNFYTRLSVNESNGTAWVADPDSLKAFSDLAHRAYFGGSGP
jgi:hypothetical protein